uniref:Uncharacterized protein n=1 Tax=viral metagenome TaxID=1070528 RepID=A0A6C0DTP6_9ZZZZ
MNANELISSKILSDVEIIADIYKIIKDAGLEATKNKEVVSLQKEVCTIQPNKPGITRFSPCVASTHRYLIKYDANDIMIVGGAALNVYDYKLRALKERRGLGALEDYIKKKTSDIDIVWWPRNASNTEIIISKSTAIIELVRVFEVELQEKLNKASKELELKIKPYITNASNADELKIYVNSFQTRPAGVFNITITFQIKNKSLKICDISVHDSGAAQKLDENGHQINYLQVMSKDPMYCNPTPGSTNSIKYLTVNGIDIAVPNIESFVKQQMLAFDNLIRLNEVKGFINYKRVEFIKQLLSSFNLNNRNNSNDLLEVFGTDSRAYPSKITGVINSRVVESIKKLYTPILSLCKTTNTSSDTIIKKLCDAAEAVHIDLLMERERQKQLAEIAERRAAQEYAAQAIKKYRQPSMLANLPNNRSNHLLANPSPAFISAANIPPGYFGWAPPSPPPHFAADIYVEYGTNRPMKWNMYYGRYYYLSPGPMASTSGSFVHAPLSGQPPLPPGPPPSNGIYNQGKNRSYNTKK